MTTSVADERIKGVRVTSAELVVFLADGRTLSTPLVWYPRLLNASPAERNDWRLIGGGYGIYWPQIDEDLSLAGMLRGVPAPGALPPSFPKEEPEDPVVRSALDFYGHSLGETLAHLEGSRGELLKFAEQVPTTTTMKVARDKILSFAEQLEAVEDTLHETAREQGVERMVDNIAHSVQAASDQAAERAQETAQEAADQARAVAEDLTAGRTQ